MSGFEIIGAVAAGLQIAEQAFKIVGRIRKKIRDSKELVVLKSDCDEATKQLTMYINDLSPGARAAADVLRVRLTKVASDIDKVSEQAWYSKLANLMRVWNGEFAKDLAAVTDKFRTCMVLEANKLLHSVKTHQDELEFCVRERAEEFIQRAERIPDVVAKLLRSELADLDLPDQLAYLGQIRVDLKQHLESLQNTEKETRIVFEGISRIEKKVDQTNQYFREQRHLLEDIHRTVSVNFRHMVGTVENITIPRSSGLGGSRVTYRSYAEFTVRAGILLPEDEIWDAIRDTILALLQLKDMGYKFSKYPGTTNLRTSGMILNRSMYNHGPPRLECMVNPYSTYWTDQLGECKPAPSLKLIFSFSSIDCRSLPWRETVDFLTTSGTSSNEVRNGPKNSRNERTK